MVYRLRASLINLRILFFSSCFFSKIAYNKSKESKELEEVRVMELAKVTKDNIKPNEFINRNMDEYLEKE